MRRILGFLGFLIITQSVIAQQDPQVTQNMFNHLAINPGYAGSIDGIGVNLLHRSQNMGFEGAPTVQFFNIHTGFKFLGYQHGGGLTIIKDQIAFNKDIGFKLDYAYRTTAGNGDLGIGLNLGFLNNKLEGAKWKTPDGLDPKLPEKSNSITFDLGLGLFYNTDNMYMGISFAHILKPRVKYEDKESYLGRAFYLTAGYNYQLGNPLFELRPSFLVSSNVASTQFTLNSLLYYNKRFWGGLSYRHNDAIAFLVGLELISGLQVGLSYDATISKIRMYGSGSFEVMVGYAFSFKVEKDNKAYKSIRYL